VPFTLVHAGKHETEDKLKRQKIHKSNTTQKKQTMQNITWVQSPSGASILGGMTHVASFKF